MMTGTRFSGLDDERLDFYLTNLMGAALLSGQLLPPLVDHTSPQAYRRWQQRLHETEPTLMDWARHGPGDPVWQERDQAIELESITVPTLCVGGSLDLLGLEGVIRSFEQISGPKKLLVGPWQHNLPNAQERGEIDFLSIALRWWDHWLRGTNNGVMDEPPISLYIQGDHPGWRAFETWPPGKGELVLTTGTSLALTESTHPETKPTQAIAEYQPDPTIGGLSGLSGIPVPAGTEPPDQHDDDMRSISATSTPLLEDLILAGRPEVTVRLAGDDGTPELVAQRIMVKLAEVNPQGRSRFLSYGSLRPNGPNHAHRVVLRPITYRIRAGNRLRITVSDADFPRLTPLPDPASFRIAGIELFTPTASDGDGVDADLPPAQKRTHEATPAAFEPRYDITRDLVRDGIRVVTGWGTGQVFTRQGYLFEVDCEAYAKVRRSAPDAALMGTTFTTSVRMCTGERILASATVRLSRAALWARGEVTIDDISVFSKIWESPLGHGDGKLEA